MSSKRALAVLLICSFPALPDAQQGPEKLSTMSVEDLLNIQVTSVSKTEQRLSQTASAIYVITQENMRWIL